VEKLDRSAAVSSSPIHSSVTMPLTQKLAYFFISSLGAAIIVYLLRAFQIITFLPGGVLLVLIILAILSGVTYGIAISRR
jgi:hypothetical protein